LCDEPSEGCEAEGELEGGLPFTEVVCSDDLSLLDSDLTKTRDEELASDDDGGDPHWAEAYSSDVDEGCCDEDFISERIEEFTEGSDEIQLPSQVTIEKV